MPPSTGGVFVCLAFGLTRAYIFTKCTFGLTHVQKCFDSHHDDIRFRALLFYCSCMLLDYCTRVLEYCLQFLSKQQSRQAHSSTVLEYSQAAYSQFFTPPPVCFK